MLDKDNTRSRCQRKDKKKLGKPYNHCSLLLKEVARLSYSERQSKWNLVGLLSYADVD